MDRFRSILTHSDLHAKLKYVSETLNRLTGYEAVEYRKQRVLEKDRLLVSMRDLSNKAKASYELMIDDRRKCQRELNALLQVKQNHSI